MAGFGRVLARGHAAFVEHVDRLTRAYVRRGDLRARDRNADRDHVRRRVSVYRPQTLAILRDRQVHGVFYDNGFEVAANPHIPVFQVREGHTQLTHSYTHRHFNQRSDTAVLDEVRRTEEVLRRIGAPLTFKGFRPRFVEADARVQALISGLGYTLSLGAVQTGDWDPARTGPEIAAAILEAPGASYPPITITVDAAADAVPTSNAPSVTGHGGVWRAQASDPIPIR